MWEGDIVSIQTAKPTPLDLFEGKLNDLSGSYLLDPIVNVITAFIAYGVSVIGREAMCVLDGNFNTSGREVQFNFICHEGALFPTPIAGPVFMTLRQDIVYPFTQPPEISLTDMMEVGHRFIKWYRKFGDPEVEGHIFITVAMFLYGAFSQLGYPITGYGERPSTRGDYTIFYFEAQKNDLRFTVEADCSVLLDMIKDLREQAKIQSHSFI